MRESPRPFVFLGYVVTKPHEGNYHILIDDANMWDIEPDDHDRWCEYIAYRGLNRVGYARISRGTITDTEVPPNPQPQSQLHPIIEGKWAHCAASSWQVYCQGSSGDGTELSKSELESSS